MSLKIFALALAASPVLVSAADAAVITKTYQVTSTFKSGPYSSISATFDATYDPAASPNGDFGAVTLSNFSATGGASFAKEDAIFAYDAAQGSRPEQRLLIIGGGGDAKNYGNVANDFQIALSVSSAGEALRVLAFAYTLDYVSYTGSGTLTDPSITTAVPEPATWAMMLLGFGMIGAASRYRRRSTITTFA